MNADERRIELDQITKKIIGCVYRVSNILGCGFLEKVYENALVIEMRRAGLHLNQQHWNWRLSAFIGGCVSKQGLSEA